MNNMNMNNMDPQMMMNMMQMMGNNNMGNNNMGMNNMDMNNMCMNNMGMNNMGMNNMGMNNMGMGNMDAQTMMQMMQMMNGNNMGNAGADGTWSLIFTKKNGAQRITVQVNSNDTVAEAISKYKIKSLDNNENKYIFNGKQLATCLSIAQSGLKNFSEISVISIGDVEGA